MPSHTRFLQSGSVWDEALTLFMHNMNHGGESINEQALQEYHNTLIEVVKKLKNEITNYSYYLTDFGRKKDGTTPHVFSGSPKFLYNAMQDDVPLADWSSYKLLCIYGYYARFIADENILVNPSRTPRAE